MAGNATITLMDNQVFEVWLQSITTSSNNLLTQQQVRDGIKFIPIRRAETFVMFTIAWPVISSEPVASKKQQLGFKGISTTNGFARMNLFQESVRAHQVAISNGTTTEPMILNYKNNSEASSPLYNKLISYRPMSPLRFEGWIKTVEMQHVRFQNVLVRSYTMNVITPSTPEGPVTVMQQNKNIAFAPTAADQRNYGYGWVNTGKLVTAANGIKGMPKPGGYKGA